MFFNVRNLCIPDDNFTKIAGIALFDRNIKDRVINNNFEKKETGFSKISGKGKRRFSRILFHLGRQIF